MPKAMRKRLLRCLLATSIVALTAACATRVPTAEMRAEYGDVAIALESRAFRVDLDPPVTSRMEAVSIGVGRGLLAIPIGMLSGALACAPGGPAMIVCAAIGGALGAIYAPISIVGSFTPLAEADRVEEAEPRLRALLSDPSLADRLVARVRERAIDRHGVRPVEFDSSTTAVIVRLGSMSLDSPSDAVTFDNAVKITTTASVRVVRRADDTVLWSGARSYQSPEHKFVAWAEDDAALLRSATDAAIQQLGENIARVVFTGMWELVDDSEN